MAVAELQDRHSENSTKMKEQLSARNRFLAESLLTPPLRLQKKTKGHHIHLLQDSILSTPPVSEVELT